MTTYGRGGFRVMAGALVVLLALALLPASAGAHAKLLRSQPAAGSTAGQPPKLVELWFNEELEPSLNTVEVKDAREPVRGTGAVAAPSPQAQGGNPADESPITWADSLVFSLGPRASRLAAAGDGPAGAGVERGFVRSVKTEALLGVLVLLATAALVFITTARGHAAGDMRINPAQIHEGR